VVALHATALSSDPAFDPRFSELVDSTAVERHGLSFSDIYHIIHEGDPFSTESKRAIVVSDDAGYGTARAYQLAKKEPPVRVFRDKDEALRWLEM